MFHHHSSSSTATVGTALGAPRNIKNPNRIIRTKKMRKDTQRISFLLGLGLFPSSVLWLSTKYTKPYYDPSALVSRIMFTTTAAVQESPGTAAWPVSQEATNLTTISNWMSNSSSSSSLFCGKPWNDFISRIPKKTHGYEQLRSLSSSSSSSSSSSVLVWTGSGGSEYRQFLESLLKQRPQVWGADIPTLVVALDQKTATRACDLGY
ncbi:hypothetical protein ACA910_008770 [Epithemia clementina (nom. ined.)]